MRAQRHIINSIFNAQPPPTPNQRKLEVQIPRPAEPSSPEAEREAAEAAQQAQAREQCTQPPPPPPPERGADAPGACRPQPTPTPPAPAVSSNEPPKPSTQGPKLSKEYLGAASHPLSAGDQQQGAAGMHVQDPSEVAKAGEGHSSAALALQDLEQAEQARMGEWTRCAFVCSASAMFKRVQLAVRTASTLLQTQKAFGWLLCTAKGCWSLLCTASNLSQKYLLVSIVSRSRNEAAALLLFESVVIFLVRGFCLPALRLQRTLRWLREGRMKDCIGSKNSENTPCIKAKEACWLREP
eukprot:1143664-Pelagomonas_calceolata.AAC.6